MNKRNKKFKFRYFAIIVLPIMILAASIFITMAKKSSEEVLIDERGLITRKTLFSNPDKSSVKISSDGSKISYLAPVKGVMNVWVGPASNLNKVEPVTRDKGRGILNYSWAFTNKHILFSQDKDGDENWRIYSLNLDTGDIVNLTPEEGVQARIQEISYKFPEEILIALNDRDQRFHDLYRVNINTGEKVLVEKNDRFIGLVTDDNYQVRFAIQPLPNGGKEYLRKKGDDWELFMEVSMADSLTTSFLGFDKTGDILYFTDSRDRNTSGLYQYNLTSDEIKLIAEDKKVDFSGAMVHPTEKNIQAVAFIYMRKRWEVIDSSVAKDLAYLKTVTDGEAEIISRTLDDKIWIVAYVRDNGPTEYYLHDRVAKYARFLFTNRELLKDLPLAKMQSTVIKSRDGLDLVSYYTLPVEEDGDSSARPDNPLPLVLLVHGGPNARDYWGFSTLHQWLANRGYAVLSVNFRGSTGFGKDFINAGNLEYGGKMHDDLIDAIDWAVDEGIADPEKIAIMGGSYGGFATLWGMTNTPDNFACGVDIVGPSNLITLLNSIPEYWQPQIERLTRQIGDHRTEEGKAFLTAHSPLTYTDNIQKPLLIGQGANDPRVKRSESDQIVKAMQEKGIPVTYLVYPDEGHGFVRPENNISFFAVTEAFLSQCLGGEYEIIGDGFQGASIKVEAGAEQVPGLSEAIGNR